MICAIATIFQDVHRNVKNVHIVFSSKILYETDQEVLTNLKSLLSSVNVRLYIGTASLKDVGTNDLVLLDEADWHLFDDLCLLP